MGPRRRVGAPRAVTAATTATALLLPTLSRASSLGDESALPAVDADAASFDGTSFSASSSTSTANVTAAGARFLYDADHRIETARIYGNIDAFAYFYIDLLIGKPAQRVSVIVDTGSGVTAFPCKACSHCGHHLDPNFDFTKSLTAKWSPCGSGCTCSQGHCSYSQGYTEGSSISGWYFTDEVQLGDALQHNPPVRMSLGCHQKENNLFYTQKANGIMGIRPPGRAPTIFDTLYADKAHINGKIFTLCLAEWGGELTVGGVNTSHHTGDVQRVPLVTKRGFYHVALTEMSVGGKVVGTTFGTTMIDSGTTYTYMSQANYKSLRSLIESQCAHGACGGTLTGTCWDAPKGVSKFPFVEMTFDHRIKTRWDPRAYLYRKGAGNKFCYGFENDGPHANTVLGASWMMYKDVIFDLQSDTVGIAPAECPSYRTRPDFGADGEGPDPVTPKPQPKPVRTPLSEIVAAADQKTKDDDDDDDDDIEKTGKGGKDDDEEDKDEDEDKDKDKDKDEDEDGEEEKDEDKGEDEDEEKDEEKDEDDEDKEKDTDKDDDDEAEENAKDLEPTNEGAWELPKSTGHQAAGMENVLDQEGRPIKHHPSMLGNKKKGHHKKEDTRTTQRVVAIIGATVLATMLVCAVCLVMMARQHNEDEYGAPSKKTSGKSAMEEGAEMVGLKQLDEEFSGEEDPLVAAVVQDPMAPNGMENGASADHHDDHKSPTMTQS